MKVLLVVTPPSQLSFAASATVFTEPLAEQYLGAGIRAHHDVKLLDLRLNAEVGLKETLESFQPDIIGCGGYSMDVNSIKKICTEAKKVIPKVLTVVGGIHATVQPEDFLTDNIDVLVQGEGVDPFKKICENYEKRQSFEKIANIYFKKNGKMVFTQKEPYPPLDSLPFPDRTLTAHLRQYYRVFIENKMIPWASIRGSVGCHFRCKFCSVTSLRNQQIYVRSIDKIVEELAMLKEPFVAWVDDELLIDPERALTLAREIEKAGIKKAYHCFARSDTIVKHPEIMEAWARVGMKYVFIGLEAFREKDLKTMRKGTNISKNDESVRICHDLGVMVRGGFIVQPDYEKKDFRNLVKYIRESRVDLATITIYTPLPGTELWKEREKELITRNYDYFDMIHPVLPTKLPLKPFIKEYVGAAKRSVSTLKRIKLLMHLPPDLRRMAFKGYKVAGQKFKAYLREITPSS